jgi:hypothetical protein
MVEWVGAAELDHPGIAPVVSATARRVRVVRRLASQLTSIEA